MLNTKKKMAANISIKIIYSLNAELFLTVYCILNFLRDMIKFGSEPHPTRDC